MLVHVPPVTAWIAIHFGAVVVSFDHCDGGEVIVVPIVVMVVTNVVSQFMLMRMNDTGERANNNVAGK